MGDNENPSHLLLPHTVCRTPAGATLHTQIIGTRDHPKRIVATKFANDTLFLSTRLRSLMDQQGITPYKIMILRLLRPPQGPLGSLRLRFPSSIQNRVLSTSLVKDNHFNAFHYDESTIVENDLRQQKKSELMTTSNSTRNSVQDEAELYGENPRVSVLMALTDRVGVLHDVLKYFWKYDINVSVYLALE